MRVPRLFPVLAVVLISACGTKTVPTTSSASPAAAPTGDVAVADEIVSSEPRAVTPKPSNFTIVIKVLSKECFGSAGCNVRYRIKPRYWGKALPLDATYEVTYKVTGGEDPQINTFTITGDGEATINQEDFVSTPSSSSTLRAKVTEVEAS